MRERERERERERVRENCGGNKAKIKTGGNYRKQTASEEESHSD